MIDRPPETFFSSSSSFEANVRTTFDPVMILESRAFPSIPSSSKKIFLQVFFLYLFLPFLTLSRGSSDKESAVNFQWLFCDSNLPLQGRNLSPKGMLLFQENKTNGEYDIYRLYDYFFNGEDLVKEDPSPFFPVSRQYLKIDNFERSLESIANAIKRILHTIILLTWRYPTTMTTNGMRL